MLWRRDRLVDAESDLRHHDRLDDRRELRGSRPRHQQTYAYHGHGPAQVDKGIGDLAPYCQFILQAVIYERQGDQEYDDGGGK